MFYPQQLSLQTSVQPLCLQVLTGVTLPAHMLMLRKMKLGTRSNVAKHYSVWSEAVSLRVWSRVDQNICKDCVRTVFVSQPMERLAVVPSQQLGVSPVQADSNMCAGHDKACFDTIVGLQVSNDPKVT